MSMLLALVIASTVSIGAIAFLTSTDRRRRKVHHNDRRQRARLPGIAAWVLTFAPAVVLWQLQQFSALLSWIGVLSVAGWLVAASPPRQSPTEPARSTR
ncbi:MAG: hypothetical protein AAGA68_16265 [Pseudomonadota bacterium]